MQTNESGDHQEVIYWRKENHFHKWFIDHCAPENYGYEKQAPIPVTKQNIQDLLTTIYDLLLKFNELHVEFVEGGELGIGNLAIDQWSNRHA